MNQKLRFFLSLLALACGLPAKAVNVSQIYGTWKFETIFCSTSKELIYTYDPRYITFMPDNTYYRENVGTECRYYTKSTYTVADNYMIRPASKLLNICGMPDRDFPEIKQKITFGDANEMYLENEAALCDSDKGHEVTYLSRSFQD